MQERTACMEVKCGVAEGFVDMSLAKDAPENYQALVH